MAAIGPGWATDAWIEASWIDTAWGAVVAAVSAGVYAFYMKRRRMHGTNTY